MSYGFDLSSRAEKSLENIGRWPRKIDMRTPSYILLDTFVQKADGNHTERNKSEEQPLGVTPEVFMSDHCLALMKAADDIFPLADKRLCTWHNRANSKQTAKRCSRRSMTTKHSRKP